MSDQVLAPTVFVDLFDLIKSGTVHVHVGQSLAITSTPPAERPGEASLVSATVPVASAALLSAVTSKEIGGQPEGTLLEQVFKAEQPGTVELTLNLENGSILGDPKTEHTVSVVIVPALTPAPGNLA